MTMSIGDMLLAIITGAVAVFLIIVLLTGCSTLSTPPEHYLPGQNYGDGGKTKCNTVQVTEADLKPCAR